MIGQQKLLNTVDTIGNNFPKFSLIVGPQGSGKKLIARYICDKLKLQMVPFGCGIEEVRNIIDLCYEQREPICYICYDADKMSVGAKNCLLKITEEPPNNSYFILTLQSLSNMLETIQSRGTVLTLDTYSPEELLQYRLWRSYNSNFDSIVKAVCTTTGEVDELFKYDVKAFYNFAETVAYKIHIPTTGNIFKISKAVKSKKDDEGYDATLLFKAVRDLYIQKAIETKKIQYLYASNVTSECLRDLALSNVSVTGTVDTWIMNVRTVLRGI